MRKKFGLFIFLIFSGLLGWSIMPIFWAITFAVFLALAIMSFRSLSTIERKLLFKIGDYDSLQDHRSTEAFLFVFFQTVTLFLLVTFVISFALHRHLY